MLSAVAVRRAKQTGSTTTPPVDVRKPRKLQAKVSRDASVKLPSIAAPLTPAAVANADPPRVFKRKRQTDVVEGVNSSSDTPITLPTLGAEDAAIAGNPKRKKERISRRAWSPSQPMLDSGSASPSKSDDDEEVRSSDEEDRDLVILNAGPSTPLASKS